MSPPVQAWHADHVRFRSLLDLLWREIGRFHEDQHPDYELMRDIVHYLTDYADEMHHPREDVAFECMAARDANLLLPVARLRQEHRVIAAAGAALLARLDDIAAEVLVARSAVEAAAATYLVYYRHHLDTEDAEILPRAAALLDERDWAAVAAARPERPDPLFRDLAEERYLELQRQLVD